MSDSIFGLRFDLSVDRRDSPRYPSSLTWRMFSRRRNLLTYVCTTCIWTTSRECWRHMTRTNLFLCLPFVRRFLVKKTRKLSGIVYRHTFAFVCTDIMHSTALVLQAILAPLLSITSGSSTTQALFNLRAILYQKLWAITKRRWFRPWQQMYINRVHGLSHGEIGSQLIRMRIRLVQSCITIMTMYSNWGYFECTSRWLEHWWEFTKHRAKICISKYRTSIWCGEEKHSHLPL